MTSGRLAARLYAYLFLGDVVLLYPVYALLFVDAGLSTAQISSLFVLWAVVGLLVEIPSGVWADVVSRRLLLVLGPVLTAVGFGLWVLVPSYPAFAAGFVLWGAGESMRSGALESLVFDALRRSGSELRYATVMGRGRAVGSVAATVGTGLAAPVMAAGGYPAVGVASIATCLAAAAVARTFPECRDDRPVETDPDVDEPTGMSGFVHVLRSGVAEVRGRPPVLGSVLLVPAVAVIWGSLEEYTPLLAAGTGATVATVPLLLLVLSAGQTVGGLLAGRGARLSRSGLAGLLVAAAALMAVGALVARPVGFVLLAVAFGAFQLATVAADARLQRAIVGPARSTVTSLAGFATDVGTIGVYGLYAAGSVVAGHATLFAVAALGYLAVAAVLLRPVLRRPVLRRPALLRRDRRTRPGAGRRTAG